MVNLSEKIDIIEWIGDRISTIEDRFFDDLIEIKILFEVVIVHKLSK